MNRTEPITLTTQRCLNHGAREAVGRCPECAHFFCRECITEHDDRIICAACLRKLSTPVTRPTRRLPSVWPVLQLGAGFASAWILFYLIGRLLLALPSEFHESSLWDLDFLDAAMQSDESRDE